MRDEAGALDPTLVAAYLGGREERIGYLADVPTSHHAPYNAARRVLSLDRAITGHAGIVLRIGDGDEVSDAVGTADDAVTADDRAERWAEYAEVLAGLWRSFPREALVGDKDAAIVVRDELLRPIRHEGRFYRVAGPIDGPASVQTAPLLAAAVVDDLGWARIAAVADLAIVDAADGAEADAELRAALAEHGRPRDAVRLLGRREIRAADLAEVAGTGVADAVAAELVERARRDRLDGLVFVVRDVAQAEVVVTDLVPAIGRLVGTPQGDTLRGSLGLGVAA